MDDALNLQKQKELQEQQELQEQSVQSLEQADTFAEPVVETESKEHAERMGKLQEGMQSFFDEFKSEWDKKTVTVANGGIDMVKDLFSSSHKVELISKFSISDFAEGTDSSIVQKKRSGTAADLMDSLIEMNELTKEEQPKLSDSINTLFELSQSSENYSLTHDKDARYYTKQGTARAILSARVNRMTKAAMDNLLTKEEKEEIKCNKDADYMEGETDKTIKKDLKRAAKAYRNYKKQILSKSQGYMQKGMLAKKLRALLLNERKIKLYRQKYPNEEDRDDDIRELIREYEECITWKKLLTLTDNKEALKDELDDVIEKHMEEEGEVETNEKDKVIAHDDKEELTDKQLKGINDIDNWLIRNFQNGGVLGSILSFVKNTDGEMVNRILSLSKRERLHMYYLVEKGKRREANIVHVGTSQNYVPDLDAFKDEIVASKLKFWKRITGDYTYTNKLSEAFQVTMQYRKEIKTVAEIERDKKKIMKDGGKADKPPAAMDSEEERLYKLTELKGALDTYQSYLEILNQAKSKREKKGAQVIVDEAYENCKRLAAQLKGMDKKVDRPDIYMHDKEHAETELNDGVTYYKFITDQIPSLIDENLKKPFGEGSEALAGLISAVTSTITLARNGKQMSQAEVTEKSLQITKTLYTSAQKGLELTSRFVDSAGVTTAKEIMGSAASVVGVAISAGVTISQSIQANNMAVHGKRASIYFERKRELLEQKSKTTELSKKEKRELKYEKNMMKLQQDLAERQKNKAIYSGVGAGLSFIGLVIPGVGTLSSVVSAIGSLHDLIHVGKLRTALFDNFFNLDKLAEDATKTRYKGNRLNHKHNQTDPPKEKVKEDLRERVAAYAGFNNMKTATEFVCAKFAKLIREKLFGTNTSELEKAGYIEFVKAINLRYNEEKKLPDERILVRKLSAQ